MKALQFDRTGDLAALELVDMPDPLPPPMRCGWKSALPG